MAKAKVNPELMSMSALFAELTNGGTLDIATTEVCFLLHKDNLLIPLRLRYNVLPPSLGRIPTLHSTTTNSPAPIYVDFSQEGGQMMN